MILGIQRWRPLPILEVSAVYSLVGCCFVVQVAGRPPTVRGVAP